MQAGAVRLQRLQDSVSDRLKLVSTEARRDQDNPSMLGIRRDGVASKLDEVHDVRGDDGPPFPRRVGKLGPVVQLGVAGLLGAGRV